MKRSDSQKYLLRGAIVAAAMVFSTAATAECLSGAEARQAVQNGQARSLASVTGGLGGEVVKAQLCRQGGRLVYVIGVLQSNGQVVRRTVDARSGQVLR